MVKTALMSEKDQKRLLNNCQTDTEYIVIWMFLNTGIHPKDLGKLTPKNIDDNNFLIWSRAKNQKTRQELLSTEIADRLKRFLNTKQRPRSRTQYWNIVHDIGLRAGLNYVSPLSLRKTFCINLLRGDYAGHPEKIDLVTKRMGCNRGTVIQNYIDLMQWEKLY